MPVTEGPRDPGGSTIEITSGITERTSRVDLKKRMAEFGDIEVCHMGTRGLDNPFVKYRTSQSAEMALEALKCGQVFLEDGTALNGDWRTTRRQGPPKTVAVVPRRDEDMSSRSLIHEEKKGRSASRGRRRSRSRRRQRSRSRKDKHRKRSPGKDGKDKARKSRGKIPQLTNGDPGPDPPKPKSEQPVAVLQGDDATGYVNPLFRRGKA